tara:strand:+ start:16838 stop:17194 length:357 start_codon:yes stop_codon:yes gene_type:complete
LNKAQLVKQLKSKGIPVPKGASTDELKHRYDNWEGGKGYLFRLAIPASRKGVNNPAHLLEFGSIYWVPNSRFARLIAETRLVFIMGREMNAPKSAVLLDVPKDFNDRWGIGVDNGSDE